MCLEWCHFSLNIKRIFMHDIVGALSFKLECFSLAVLSFPGHVQAKGKPSLSDMKFNRRV